MKDEDVPTLGQFTKATGSPARRRRIRWLEDMARLAAFRPQRNRPKKEGK